MTKKKQEALFRTATFNREAINEEDRTIELSFSSEEPYERWSPKYGNYLEVLGHKDDEIDTTFIGSGRAPLLADHEPTKQIGVVEAVQISDGRARALVRVSRSALGTEFLQDIVDGIRTNVSVGYYVIEEQEVGKSEKNKVVRATRWRPIEVSIVSIPADETVGVGRSDSQEEIQETTITEGVIEMTDENKQPQLDVEAIKREAAASEQARVREIASLGAKFGMTKEAEEFVRNNKPAEDFRAYVLENMSVESKKTAVKAEKSDASIGMSEKEVKNYSFLRALRAGLDPKFAKEAGFELEVSRAAAEKRGQEARGIIIPHDVLVRDLSVTLGGPNVDGSKVVATDLLTGSFIDILRNKMVVAGLGATMLTGLRGNVAIPKQSGAATAYWIATEGDAPNESQQTMTQVALTPKTLGAFTDYTRQLLLQSSIDVESFVRNDLATVIALAVDKAALYGTGANGQPQGLDDLATQGSNFGAAVPTYEELVLMEGTVDTNNALMGNISYLVHPSMKASLKTAVIDAGSGRFVWEGNTVNGYNAVASAQVTNGDVFFGNWSDLLIGMWGGLDVTVDPYALSTSGGVRVIALQSVDVAVRHAASFVFDNDGV